MDPDDGEVIDRKRPYLYVKIADDVDPKSLQLHLGDHPMVFHYNAKTHELTHKIGALLHSGGHMVILSAKDRKGQKRIYTWYFRVKHDSLKNKQVEETNDAY